MPGTPGESRRSARATAAITALLAAFASLTWAAPDDPAVSPAPSVASSALTVEDATALLCLAIGRGAPPEPNRALESLAGRVLGSRAETLASRARNCRAVILDLVQLLWSFEPPPEVDRALRGVRTRVLAVDPGADGGSDGPAEDEQAAHAVGTLAAEVGALAELLEEGAPPEFSESLAMVRAVLLDHPAERVEDEAARVAAGLAALIGYLRELGPPPEDDARLAAAAGEIGRSVEAPALARSVLAVADVVGRSAPPQVAEDLATVRTILGAGGAADVRRVRRASITMVEYLRCLGLSPEEDARLAGIVRNLGGEPAAVGERARSERLEDECAAQLAIVAEGIRRYVERHGATPTPGPADAESDPSLARAAVARLFEEGFLPEPVDGAYRGLVRRVAREAPPETPILWDAAPLHAGRRHVLRLGGGIDLVPEAEFRALMERYGIPPEG